MKEIKKVKNKIKYNQLKLEYLEFQKVVLELETSIFHMFHENWVDNLKELSAISFADNENYCFLNRGESSKWTDSNNFLNAYRKLSDALSKLKTQL